MLSAGSQKKIYPKSEIIKIHNFFINKKYNSIIFGGRNLFDIAVLNAKNININDYLKSDSEYLDEIVRFLESSNLYRSVASRLIQKSRKNKKPNRTIKALFGAFFFLDV